MPSKADDVILKIEKRISERLAPYVGRTTVPNLMAVARRIASTSVLQVLRAENLNSIALGKLPEGDVFLVVQDHEDPSVVNVLLQEPLRRLVEREKRAASRNDESEER